MSSWGKRFSQLKTEAALKKIKKTARCAISSNEMKELKKQKGVHIFTISIGNW